MVKSVRLACLMCAASVYPEPGSNSLVFGIYILSFDLYKSFFTSSFLDLDKLISFSLFFNLFGNTFFVLPLGYFSLKDSLFTFQCTLLFLTERFVLYYTFFSLSTLF